MGKIFFAILCAFFSLIFFCSSQSPSLDESVRRVRLEPRWSRIGSAKGEISVMRHHLFGAARIITQLGVKKKIIFYTSDVFLMKPGASHNGAVLSCKTAQPCEFQRTFVLGNFPPIETLFAPPHPPNKECLSQRNLETAEAFLTVAFPKKTNKNHVSTCYFQTIPVTSFWCTVTATNRPPSTCKTEARSRSCRLPLIGVETNDPRRNELVNDSSRARAAIISSDGRWRHSAAIGPRR